MKNFTISQYLATAIVNDDYSGLTDTDISAIDSWSEKNDVAFIAVPVFCEDESHVHMGKCDITGLMSEVVEVIAHKHIVIA